MIRHSARRNFTMLEILVVVAMIVVLAGLLAGTLFKSKEKARRDAQSAQNVKILTAINKFKDDFGIYPLEGDGAGSAFVRDANRQKPRAAQNAAQTYANNVTGETLAKCLAWNSTGETDEPEDQDQCVGNYLIKGEVKLSADGKILDTYGNPLIYWLRYQEKDDADFSLEFTEDASLTAEIWSQGADGKSDQHGADLPCLRLGAYRVAFGGGVDNTHCLYRKSGGHTTDDDNVGGDLNQQKK